METYNIHKVDENLVVSMVKLPGFGKLGSAVVCMSDKTKQYLDLYYAGGLFKRNPDDAVMKKVTESVVTIASNYVNRRKIAGRVVDISFTSVLRPQAHEHQV